MSWCTSIQMCHRCAPNYKTQPQLKKITTTNIWHSTLCPNDMNQTLVQFKWPYFLILGFTIFSVLGNLANELNVPIEEVIKSGQGLAFISYPTAIAKFDYVPQLFAVLFFLMLFTLGLGSATGTVKQNWELDLEIVGKN